jgi:hypothetical protein
MNLLGLSKKESHECKINSELEDIVCHGVSNDR